MICYQSIFIEHLQSKSLCIPTHSCAFLMCFPNNLARFWLVRTFLRSTAGLKANWPYHLLSPLLWNIKSLNWFSLFPKSTGFPNFAHLCFCLWKGCMFSISLSPFPQHTFFERRYSKVLKATGNFMKHGILATLLNIFVPPMSVCRIGADNCSCLPG